MAFSNKDFPLLHSIANKITEQLKELSLDELKALTEECDKLSETNCWWFMYQLHRPIKNAADSLWHNKWLDKLAEEEEEFEQEV